MKKYFSLVLLLCILICSQAEKNKLLSKKTSNESGLLAVTQLIKNNASKQLGTFIYDSSSNAVRIKRIEEFLIIVLNFFGFDQAIQKIRNAEINLLLDAMNACNSVAKGDLKAIENLRNIFETITGSKIAKESMDKVAEFIKHKISPNSTLSTSKDKFDDEIKNSLQKTKKIIQENKYKNKSSILPYRKKQKRGEEKIKDKIKVIKDELKNDELEIIEQNSIRQPALKRKSKNSYAFITEEEDKSISKTEKKSDSESKDSKNTIKMLLSKVEKIEEELQDMATQKSVDNLSGKVSSIESQSKTFSDNLEKQSTQSKESAKDLLNQIDLLRGNCKIFGGQTKTTDWQPYNNSNGGIFVTVDISNLALKSTPIIITSIHGQSTNWEVTGSSSVYPAPDNKSFRSYIRFPDGRSLTPQSAQNFGWYISYIVCYKD